MAGITSATGLMAARVCPIYRPEPKQVEISGSTKPAPFALRPFSGIFNPYPYGCSVLCNHPADCEAKEVVRRAKDSWATEGKALLLPEEMEMIRANLLATAGNTRGVGGNVKIPELVNSEGTPVPEEFFRKYTETDSRPPTPTPTLLSGTAFINRTSDELPITCNPRERATLVLDLRANSRNQENETFTWHALTLEPPPTPRKPEVSPFNYKSKPTLRPKVRSPLPTLTPTKSPACVAEISETESAAEDAKSEENDNVSDEPVIVRRRGKRLRKRKCRRGSIYGQQTEVRDLLEPTVTQISQIGDASRRTSVHTCKDDPADASPLPEKSSTLIPPQSIPQSFIPREILKHLCRELDRDKVEAEFSAKRRIAFDEALRIKGEGHLIPRGWRQGSASPPIKENIPRVFSRQAARFEIFDSRSLEGLTSLEYLSKHVFVTSGRKLIFSRAFSRFAEETIHGIRHMSPDDIYEALEEVIGKALTEEQKEYLSFLIGEIKEPFNFRTWCGLCAMVERLLCPLPQKDVDPSTWLERVDFEALERRIESADIDSKLVLLLREIRDK